MFKEVKDLSIINYFLNKFEVKIEQLTNPYNYYLGYYLENQIIGFIALSIIYDKAEIDYIYVENEYRGQKIASFILEYTIDLLKNKKCTNITLEVKQSNNRAINLYEKFGFKRIAIRKHYYHNEDAILMLRELG